MSHYEERLEKDLTAIRRGVRDVGDDIRSALDNASHAVLTVDRALAADTILGDLQINRATRDIEHQCHVFVARHLPSAGNLRFVSSVLRLCVVLERIGDYAETIARAAVQLSEPPPSSVARDVEMMADQSRVILGEAMNSFNDLNPDRAAATLGVAGEFAATFDKVFADLIRVGEKQSRPINDMFLLLASFNRLERAIHQAKNICEETIFAVTGETKGPKTFQVLMVDGSGGFLAALSTAFARKAYPKGGQFTAATWSSVVETDPDVREFADEQGLDLEGQSIDELGAFEGRFNAFDVIVFLEGDSALHLEEVPFHTVVLNWDIDSKGGGDGISGTYKAMAEKMNGFADRLYGSETD